MENYKTEVRKIMRNKIASMIMAAYDFQGEEVSRSEYYGVWRDRPSEIKKQFTEFVKWAKAHNYQTFMSVYDMNGKLRKTEQITIMRISIV